MNVSAIKGTEAVNAKVELKKAEVKEEAQAVSTEGYAQKEAAPADANLYKAMYGVQDKKDDYKEAMKEHLEKWGTEEQLKQVQEPEQTKEEEEFYKAYLEYKHKYE